MIPGSPPPVLVGLPVARDAFAYAAELHRGQVRESDLAPFILHPLEVAMLLRGRGFGDEVVAAALLHDAIEDTEATAGDLGARFGPGVCRLVAALSDDPSVPDRRERKRRLREQVAAAGPDALAIFAADKVAKARELRATVTRDPSASADPSIALRLEHYEASAEMLEHEAPELPLVAQLRFELWALRNLPPAR